MAESNGLLDFAKSPAAMGLLAAGFGGLAGANKNTPWNNLGRAGLAGVAGYSAADALQQKQRDQDKAAAIQAAIPTLYGDDGKIDYQKGLAIGMEPAFLKGMAELPNAGRAKVARTLSVPGIDGRPMTIQLDDYGQQVSDGIGTYQKPEMINTGDRIVAANPVAGQSFGVNLSPSQRDASARGWANVAVRKDGNDVLREGNDIQRQAARTQVVTMPDGSLRLVDKGTGAATSPSTPDGKPLPTAPAKLTEGESKGALFLSQMLDASKAMKGLDVSPIAVAGTNSYSTNWMVPEDAQRVAQAQRQWAEPYLRIKTGAAATQGEIDANIKTFFPVAGDSRATIERKAQARAQAEQDMQIAAGRGASQIKPVNNDAVTPQSGSYPSTWTPEKIKRFEELKARQSQGAAQ